MKRVVVLIGLLWTAAARAELATCDGPIECCPKQLIEHLPKQMVVSVGVAFRALYNVDDKMSTWDSDYYLYESWKPTPGFFPQTEVVNEVSRQSSQFDETILKAGECTRSRRIHSTLHSRFHLKRFPFDEQQLTLELADAEFDSNEVTYDPKPLHLAINDDARKQVAAWRVLGQPSFALGDHPFSWQQGSPSYTHATIGISVRRQEGFYITRFFLPLFLILTVALSVFWIHPEDLSSQVGVGVTCLLAVIAFQFAQASALPAVAYLTFADRVYAVCYFAIALALIESIWSNTLARRGEHERAQQIDRFSRWAFPIGTAVLIAGGLAIS